MSCIRFSVTFFPCWTQVHSYYHIGHHCYTCIHTQIIKEILLQKRWKKSSKTGKCEWKRRYVIKWRTIFTSPSLWRPWPSHRRSYRSVLVVRHSSLSPGRAVGSAGTSWRDQAAQSDRPGSDACPWRAWHRFWARWGRWGYQAGYHSGHPSLYPSLCVIYHKYIYIITFQIKAKKSPKILVIFLRPHLIINIIHAHSKAHNINWVWKCTWLCRTMNIIQYSITGLSTFLWFVLH